MMKFIHSGLTKDRFVSTFSYIYIEDSEGIVVDDSFDFILACLVKPRVLLVITEQ